LVDHPRNADEQCGVLRKRLADRRKRIGRVAEKEGQRRLRPDHEVHLAEPFAPGEVEIFGEDFCAVLRPPLIGLVDIGLDDAKADSRGFLGGGCEPALGPHIAQSQEHEENPRE